MVCCNICGNNFTQKFNLNKHLTERRCKGDLLRINELIEEKNKLIEELAEKIEINAANGIVKDNAKNVNIGNNNTINNINMKIEIQINPVTKLQIGHIETDKMKHMIEKYDDDKEMVGYKEKFNNDKVNLLLSGYIKDIICDSSHPENHAVKYIKKKPPTYNALVEDSEGNTVSVIKGLKDTCELLTDPILDQLKIKLKEFIIKYKKDTEPDFDYVLYENAIKELKKELNKSNVKKALSSVLKNDILNNIEMKLNVTEDKSIKLN